MTEDGNGSSEEIKIFSERLFDLIRAEVISRELKLEPLGLVSVTGESDLENKLRREAQAKGANVVFNVTYGGFGSLHRGAIYVLYGDAYKVK